MFQDAKQIFNGQKASRDVQNAGRDIVRSAVGAVEDTVGGIYNATLGKGVDAVSDYARDARRTVADAAKNPGSVIGRGKNETTNPGGWRPEPVAESVITEVSLDDPSEAQAWKRAEAQARATATTTRTTSAREAELESGSSRAEATFTKGSAPASSVRTEPREVAAQPSKRNDAEAMPVSSQSNIQTTDNTPRFRLAEDVAVADAPRNNAVAPAAPLRALGEPDQKLIDAGILLPGVDDPANARMKAHLNSWADTYNQRSDIPSQISKLKVDKHFTAEDVEVVKRFQEEHKVDIKGDGTGTGSAGPATLRALAEYSISAGADARANAVDQGTPLSGEGVMIVGERGKAVTEMQARLRTATGEDIVPDGSFGPKTLEALRKFEAQQGLKSDPSGASKDALDALLRFEPDKAAIEAYKNRPRNPEPAKAAGSAAPGANVNSSELSQSSTVAAPSTTTAAATAILPITSDLNVGALFTAKPAAATTTSPTAAVDPTIDYSKMSVEAAMADVNPSGIAFSPGTSDASKLATFMRNSTKNSGTDEAQLARAWEVMDAKGLRAEVASEYVKKDGFKRSDGTYANAWKGSPEKDFNYMKQESLAEFTGLGERQNDYDRMAALTVNDRTAADAIALKDAFASLDQKEVNRIIAASPDREALRTNYMTNNELPVVRPGAGYDEAIAFLKSAPSSQDTAVAQAAPAKPAQVASNDFGFYGYDTQTPAAGSGVLLRSTAPEAAVSSNILSQLFMPPLKSVG